MSVKTAIAWTDATWNPIVGCSKVSAGCVNCYAEKAAAGPRLQKITQYAAVTRCDRWTGWTSVVASQIDKPLHWKKPRRVFVCSMGDLFHERNDPEWIDAVFSVISRCPQHTFQVLTKRPRAMLNYFLRKQPGAGAQRAPANVWLGVSVEDQDFVARIIDLFQIDATVHFISYEPALGPLVLSPAMIEGLHWVIAGGESGANARPCHIDWFRAIRDQCVAARTPFFFKQLGGARKGNLDEFLDGREWKEFPK